MADLNLLDKGQLVLLLPNTALVPRKEFPMNNRVLYEEFPESLQNLDTSSLRS